MRELKFRAWDKFNKKMIQPKDGDFIAWHAMSNWKDCLIVMQFTGKYDCGGTPIFDGDIIEFDRNEWGGDDNIHIVSWDDHNAEWSWGGGITSDMGYRTVIGNIHANPDLIK